MMIGSLNSFSRTVNIVLFVSGILDRFDIMCKQHHMIIPNPFLDGTKISDVYGTCKQSVNVSFIFLGYQSYLEATAM